MNWKKFSITTACCLLAWLLFTLNLSLHSILAGLFCALLVAAFCSEMFVSKEGWKITLVRISATLTYIPIFLKKVIWANADLIRRILSLKIPLNPAILKIPTKVKSDLGITSLSNSITLTPGTLTVDAEEGYLYVHWIDAKTLEPKKAEKAIKGAFELSLKEVFK